MVYLVGAGPGDAGLLTLRGAELLQRADVVVYDALANPELLRHAPASAEFISRGKNMEMPQAEITATIIAKAKAGKMVVRLKGGDPFVFGRGGEEAEALLAEKISFEIVPGVSSITAVPNYAGIPLTHREHCSSFTVFTGHSDSADAATVLRYEQIAKIPGTKVVLMGTENLGDWTKSLIAHGMSPQTPVAVIQHGTLGKQKSASGTLANIAQLVAEKKIVPPALTIIGDVVTLREKLNWFESKPLFGKRIVVTRRSEQAGIFAARLAELGADVLSVPTIKLTTPTERDAIIDCLLELNSYEWFVFTSANGVTAFFDLFFKRFQDLRDLGGARIAAVGQKRRRRCAPCICRWICSRRNTSARKLSPSSKNFKTSRTSKCACCAPKWRTGNCPTRCWKPVPSWTTSPSTKRFLKLKTAPAQAHGSWKKARIG